MSMTQEVIVAAVVKAHKSDRYRNEAAASRIGVRFTLRSVVGVIDIDHRLVAPRIKPTYPIQVGVRRFTSETLSRRKSVHLLRNTFVRRICVAAEAQTPETATQRPANCFSGRNVNH